MGNCTCCISMGDRSNWVILCMLFPALKRYSSRHKSSHSLFLAIDPPSRLCKPLHWMFPMNWLLCSPSFFRPGTPGFPARIGFDLSGLFALGKGYEECASFPRDAPALHPDEAVHGLDQLAA